MLFQGRPYQDKIAILEKRLAIIVVKETVKQRKVQEWSNLFEVDENDRLKEIVCVPTWKGQFNDNQG